MSHFGLIGSVVVAGLISVFPAVAAAQVCLTPPSGLAGWWPGNGDAADAAAGNGGLLMDTTTFAPAVVGAGFKMDGIADGVQIADAAALRPSTVSVEAWVRFDSLDTPIVSQFGVPGLQFIVFKKNTRQFNFEGYSLHKERVAGVDRLAFRVTGASGTGNIAVSTTAVTVGQFYHVVGTYDGAQVRLYVNGVQEAQSPANIPLDYDTRPVFIGTSGETVFDGKLNGVVDEASIYGRPLAAAEIMNLHQAGTAGKCLPAQSTTTVVASVDGHATACGNLVPPQFTSLVDTTPTIETYATTFCVQRGVFEFTLPDADPSTLVSASFRATVVAGGGPFWLLGYAGDGVLEPADASRSSAFVSPQFSVTGGVPQVITVPIDLTFAKSLLGSTLGLASRGFEPGSFTSSPYIAVASLEGPAPTRPALVLTFAQAPPAGNTQPGSNVTVSPSVPTGGPGVTVTFDTVLTSGDTSVRAAADVPPPPAGFKLTDPPAIVDIQTTSAYAGAIRVCLAWTEGQVINEQTVALHHLENGEWVDITEPDTRDTISNVLCGTTLSLSPFALFDVKFPFTGFFAPIENAPTMNAARAGSAVPVKFSLGGDLGLDVLAGAPRVQLMQCDSLAPIDEVPETIVAANSGLSYDPETGLYVYVWKTERGWAGSCRELQVRLTDGEVYTARFTFRK
jgi:hypothetical protein